MLHHEAHHSIGGPEDLIFSKQEKIYKCSDTNTLIKGINAILKGIHNLDKYWLEMVVLLNKHKPFVVVKFNNFLHMVIIFAESQTKTKTKQMVSYTPSVKIIPSIIDKPDTEEEAYCGNFVMHTVIGAT